MSKCPEAFRHGPADGRGRCPWCGQKFTTAVSAPAPQDFDPSDLTTAYEEFYDPNFGALSRDEIRHRFSMGLD